MSAKPVTDNNSSTVKSKKKSKKKNKPKDPALDTTVTKEVQEEPQDGEDVDDEIATPVDNNENDEDGDADATEDTEEAALINQHQEESANSSGQHSRKASFKDTNNTSSSESPERRLELASLERDKLRAEVTELRRSLEELQSRHVNGSKDSSHANSHEADEINNKLQSEISELRQALSTTKQEHEEELATINARLEQVQTSKEHAESRYQKLLGQVNTIKTQLGERLKADADELSAAREQIEELEEQITTFKTENESLQSQITQATSGKDRHEQEYNELRKELAELRDRTSNSQKNWARERDDLLSREAQAREEYEVARQAMQDWEVLATEERAIRDTLNDRVAELEEQLSSQRETYDRIVSERDEQSGTVDGLQRALQEIQAARKTELREIVENSQTQLEQLRQQQKAAEEAAIAAQSALETTRQELERALPYEKEVREKNLQIGKLRHEAVILSDHLTKALRFLKKGKPQDNVDRQLVTNHLLQFLSLDRSDPKKYQILQLISALLGWTEEQNEQAGLSRPGASTQPINPAQTSSLRVPFSPFRRVSSSTSLNSPRSPSANMSLNNVFNSPSTPSMEFGSIDSPNGSRPDSLADLWSSFLEREAQEGTSTPSVKGHSRRTSLNSTTSSTLPRNFDRRKEKTITEDGIEK